MSIQDAKKTSLRVVMKAVLTFGTLLFGAISSENPAKGQESDFLNEVVMTPGMKIKASTSVGTIEIFASSGLSRVYNWEGFERSIKMGTRKKRWFGKFGVYYPGPGNHWEDAGGIRRFVGEEARVYFQDDSEMMRWIEEKNTWYENEFGKSERPFVAYSNTGLVVVWNKDLLRNQLSVNVFQFVVDGKQPTNLPKVPDGAIEISYVTMD